MPKTAREIGIHANRKWGVEPIPDKPAPDAIEWISSNFYLYDTQKLISLFECQVRPLKLALMRDENGRFLFNTILWAWPKKSAKSSVIAAVADYTANHRTNASVKLIANDLKQADSRVGMYIRENIKIAQRQGLRPGITMNTSGYHIRYPNGAKVESVPIDPKGEAGGNDDMMVFSELWGWKTKAHQQMWTEMTVSPTKFGFAQRWIDTYAGIKGESPVLEQVWHTGVDDGVKVWDDLEVYINKQARMLAVCVTKPMFPWQTEEYYAQERSLLTESEFNRVHRDQWSESSETFVPYAWWMSCKVKELAPLNNRGVVMALDAASKDDCFACVIVSNDRKNGAEVRYSNVWSPKIVDNKLIEAIQFDKVEDEIKRLIKEFNVVEIAFDETQLVSTSQRLGGLANWRAFPQGHARAVADKRLYDMIRDRLIKHTGDVDLSAHIQNANRKPEDDKIRIVKSDDNRKKIDAAVALSMAVDRAMWLSL